jgi:hypothetical protein
VVKLLLKKNADVNAQGGKYGNALQAVSKGGHEQVVLLDELRRLGSGWQEVYCYEDGCYEYNVFHQ